ncbi:uncharacterized protein NECHADRAFT_89369 [Fusarium vanettenii 77-13-4]|uniref:Uncharacterized protein n=1 Tax=Fusarium vanettenii (strain ATCC MYA-4622 / CBS 123669 / FGSC 9596 / NRRL 45880 / 77-13-4) TaxID=660122 RepID=C7ZR01_FUSV7|nr:uncharacterized protein NECHADRAFT_89369 [Fusarium vanettenii 77-13-4]EEU33556.1 predicted protein [Fusarium vanettenii 77-13-4]
MTGVESVDRLHGGIDFQPELAKSLQAKPSTTREDEQYPQAHTRLTVALESVSSSYATATDPPDSRTRCSLSSNMGLHHHVFHIKCTNRNGTAATPLSHCNLESATDSDGKKDDTIRCSEIVDYMAVVDFEHIILRIFALSVRAWEQHIEQQTQTGEKEPEHG